MLGFFRNMAATWPARIFFAALALAFIGWGVSGKINLGGSDPSAVAMVGDSRVPAATFDQQYRAAMQRLSQQFPDPSQMPAGLRKQVAEETLNRMIAQTALDDQARHLGLAAPDAAVQASIKSTPAFAGLDGKFDHDKYLQVLHDNNLTPGLFQEIVRGETTKNQLLGAAVVGGTPSDTLVKLAYAYVNEARSVDMVQVPLAGHTPPADPGDTVLQRYYANNPSKYTAPEYRHIRVVVLSPDSIGRSLPLTDVDLRAWYDAHKADFTTEETRALQVITVGAQAPAEKLAAKWNAGASWDDMQAAAKSANATATSLDDTSKAGIPAPELADAAFAAPLNVVTGPVKEPLGYQLVRVTAITPAKHPTFTDMRDTVRTKLGEERAADLIDARAQKLQDLFAGGSRMDEVPADIGAAGAEGTLDAKGNTPDGPPAPLPATGAARTKIIADAFAAKKGETTQFTEGPDHVWYEVLVDNVTPATPRPFATMRAGVLADWQAEQIRHDTESEAARLLATIKGGQTIAAAAWGTGRQVTRSAPIMRTRAPVGVPEQLAQIVFSLKQGEPTMVESPTGYVVATVAEIRHPDPAADKSGMEDIRRQIAASLRDMMANAYATSVMRETRVVPNQQLVNQLTGGPAE